MEVNRVAILTNEEIEALKGAGKVFKTILTAFDEKTVDVLTSEDKELIAKVSDIANQVKTTVGA